MPHGELFKLPFESLISEYSNEVNRYLIEDFLIRYAFSGSIICNNTHSAKGFRSNIAAFMPFTIDRNFSNLSQLKMDDDIFDTAELDHVNVKYFKGENATKSNLLTCNNKYKILHFSSHGFGGENESPSISLADSSFTMSELYATSISTDLVILSACKTNLGKTANGEGVLNMTRGFTYAGAKSVISSLWNVLAAPTANIVKRFYLQLVAGSDKATALRNAKLAYLADPSIPSYEKSPYYWSGLIFHGQNNEISFNKTSGRFWRNIGFGLCIIMCILFLIRKRQSLLKL